MYPQAAPAAGGYGLGVEPLLETERRKVSSSYVSLTAPDNPVMLAVSLSNGLPLLS